MQQRSADNLGKSNWEAGAGALEIRTQEQSALLESAGGTKRCFQKGDIGTKTDGHVPAGNKFAVRI